MLYEINCQHLMIYCDLRLLMLQLPFLVSVFIFLGGSPPIWNMLVYKCPNL